MIGKDLLGEDKGLFLDDRRVVVGVHHTPLYEPPAQIDRIGRHRLDQGGRDEKPSRTSLGMGVTHEAGALAIFWRDVGVKFGTMMPRSRSQRAALVGVPVTRTA